MTARTRIAIALLLFCGLPTAEGRAQKPRSVPTAPATLQELDSEYRRERSRLLRAGASDTGSASMPTTEIVARIVSVIPDSASPGTLVSIFVTGIDLTKASAVHVHFDSIEAEYHVLDSAAMEVTVPELPAGATPSITARGTGWATSGYSDFVALPRRGQPTAAPRTLAWAAATALLLAFGVGAYFVRQRRKLEQILDAKSVAHQDRVDDLLWRVEQEFGQSESEAARFFVEAAESLVPAPPDELIDALVRGECVLFAGPGASADSGLPTRLQLIASLISQVDEATASRVRRALDGADPSAAADIIAGRLPRASLHNLLQRAYAENERGISTVHRKLGQLPFGSAFTTNYDTQIEQAFATRTPIALSIANTNGMSDALRPEQFVVVHLYGDLTDADSFLFVPDELQAALFHNPTFAKLLITELSAKTWLFIGTSIEGINGLLSAIPERQLGIRTHFALVPYRRDWEVQEERLSARNITLLGFNPTPGFPEVAQFVDALTTEYKERRSRTKDIVDSPVAMARLRSLQLNNIGPFRQLTVDFTSRWTVVLGNNGSGKSTILRAIALAFCGDDISARAAAERLLRIGETTGSIEMTFDDVSYRTYLTRDLSGITVKSAQFTPTQRGTAAVLGFPPLRGFSVRDPVGAAPTGTSQASIADVLPLLNGGVDTRMDSLKQWLVNVEVNAQDGGGITPAEATRNTRLRENFFRIMRELSPGTQVEFGRVDRRSWKVFVETPDGSVHLDQVSQGMSSLLGWVGTSLQRMYEMWPDEEHPEHGPAIFLVDEIDAHLHPEWQQVLVRLLSQNFPYSQFIATTHSSLVVAGMKSAEVLIARRDENDATQLSVTTAPIELEGLRADQILTSPLFGLATTRSLDTLDDINQLSMLAGKQNLTDDDQAELARLEAKVKDLLVMGETPLQRRIEEAVRTAVDNALNEMPVHHPSALHSAAKLEMQRQLEGLFEREAPASV
jgi:hypothetical protein